MIDVRPSGPDDASPALRIGVDTGGTFTDCVLWDPSTGGMTVAKVPSQPLRPEAAVAEGLAELTRVAAIEPSAVGFVGHGTTIATNALITGEVAAVGLLTNRGFRDVLEIGTQQRPLLYPLHQRPRTLLVPRDRRMGIRGRIGPLGNVLEELDEAEVADAARSLAGLGVDAIAIAMLFSFANPAQERRVEAIVREVVPGIHVARSSEVSSELREYPRFTTTAVNAALAPLLDRYIGAVDRSLRDTGYGAPLHVIQSNGGVATAERSIHANAHRLVLSGPAAGVIGGSHVASAAGFDDVVTLDIGGTSADVGVVVGGRPRMATGLVVGDGLPLQIAAIEVETIGAGGGSIASVDAGGTLRVGPRSAGASPGPVCYGAGGTEPTLTDAHLLLGRLDPDGFLGGRIRLHPELAERAIVERIAVPMGLDVEGAARAILAVAEAKMVGAIRQAAARHGDDVREFALVAAGGAGPLHAVALAAELGMRAVCVPLAPGLLSALGLLAADLRHDLSSPLISFMEDLTSERVEAAFGGLEADAHALLDAEGVSEGNRRIERAIDIRSVGQEWSLGVPVEPGDSVAAMVDRFHQRHDRVYGHSSPGEPVESVAIRVVARGIFPRPRIEPPPAASEPEPAGHRPVWFPEASGFVRAAVVDRASIGPGSEVVGPAVITQLDTTVLVPPGHVARRVAMGSLAIRSAGAPDA